MEAASTNCPACTRSYSLSRLPIRLPCKHILCNKCISKTYSSSSYRCHICHATAQIPLEDLPIHRKIYNTLMRQLSSKCEEHQKTFHWYCQDCATMLCKRCIAQHAKHPFSEIEDKSVREMISQKLEQAETQARVRLTEVTQYRDRILDNLQDLESEKVKIQQSIRQRSKMIRVFIKTLTQESLSKLSSLFTEARSSMTALVAEAGDVQEQCSEAYKDFNSTAASLKSLDLCSQVKFIDKLTLWPDHIQFQMVEPTFRLEDMEKVESEFRAHLEQVFEEQIRQGEDDRGLSPRTVLSPHSPLSEKPRSEVISRDQGSEPSDRKGLESGKSP